MMVERKNSHLDTSRICTAAGFRFIPLVVEAHGGGWDVGLGSAVAWIARSAESLGHDKESSASIRIAQRIACSLQRENARAMLRRMPTLDHDVAMSCGVVAVQIDAESAHMWQ